MILRLKLPPDRSPSPDTNCVLQGCPDPHTPGSAESEAAHGGSPRLPGPEDWGQTEGLQWDELHSRLRSDQGKI